MIIGLSERCIVGSVEWIDYMDESVPGGYRENIPVMILREATAEEWVIDARSRSSRKEANAEFLLRMRQFPDAHFYDVSVD